MKTYEIHISASYIAAGSRHYNSFKEYREAKSAAEAKKNLKAELRAEGYRNIEMEAIEV